MTTGIVKAIDAAIAPVCGWCSTPLPATGPSTDFCCEQHQLRWASVATRTLPPPTDLTIDLAEFRELVDVYRRAFTTVATELGAIFRGFASSVNAACSALVEAGVIEKPLPADPKARALELRRCRNTGPRVGQRAQKRIDPTRRRA